MELWHGGRRWEGGPEIQAPKRGRYECGPGIYLTNKYDRARKYAKGGGVTLKVKLADTVRWLEEARLPVATLESYVRDTRGLRKKADILEDLRSAAERMGGDTLPASFLVNLCVNHEAVAGEQGVRLAAWLAEQGIDASMHSVNAEEDWVVVFNPAVIKRYEVISASTISGCADFPKAAAQR